LSALLTEDDHVQEIHSLCGRAVLERGCSRGAQRL